MVNMTRCAVYVIIPATHRRQNGKASACSASEKQRMTRNQEESLDTSLGLTRGAKVGDGSFDHLCLSVTNEELIKEGENVGEASEKKEGRNASVPSRRSTWKRRVPTWYISPNHSCRFRLSMIRRKCHEAMSIR
jgi:hypothetical protein